MAPAQLRGAQDGSAAEGDEQTEPYKARLMWRTLFRSPCVEWILPGRICKDDGIYVTFVGEFYIQLKEWERQTETLKTVATFSDLPCRIRSAQILGERPKKNHERSDFAATNMNAEADSPLPPQQLIVMLENATMLLLIARKDVRGGATWDVHAQPIVAKDSLRQAGRHLATEPRRRAIAIGASDDTLTIFALRHTCTALDPLRHMVSLTSIYLSNSV